MSSHYIDEEEKELMEAYHSIENTNLSPLTEEEQRPFKDAAKAFKEKETKMNIRINPEELEKIKEFAGHEGLKYQTFVKSVLHKYITGQLVEKREKLKSPALTRQNSRTPTASRNLQSQMSPLHSGGSLPL